MYQLTTMHNGFVMSFTFDSWEAMWDFLDAVVSQKEPGDVLRFHYTKLA